jgi:TRAP-type mannitol/chloroaromatic compound transport system permease small subunit
MFSFFTKGITYLLLKNDHVNMDTVKRRLITVRRHFVDHQL